MKLVLISAAAVILLGAGNADVDDSAKCEEVHGMTICEVPRKADPAPADEPTHMFFLKAI